MKKCWRLKFGRSVALLFIVSSQPLLSLAQAPLEVVENETKYVFPVHAGQPASLAGTMGELRSTHLHSGIDIRTYNQIGWPVVAAADGYVSRILVSYVGYGNGLYLTHTDGSTTLYGHLDHFIPALQDYTTNERYRLKQSAVNLFPSRELFPVKKGDTIAFSGNSGSSGGPHLHFEIRDKNNDALNPQRYGFKEIVDNMPPVAEKLAFKTMDIHSRINDQFGRFEFYVERNGNNYILSNPILAWGKIGIELLAHDQLDNSIGYRCGFNRIEVKVNAQTVLRQTIDKISFSETRLIMTMLDYATLESTGSRFIKLFIDDGNTLSYYKTGPEYGLVKVNGDHDIPVDVIMTDSHDNASHLTFKFHPSAPAKEVIETGARSSTPSYKVLDNTLTVQIAPCANGLHKAWTYVNGNRTEVIPDYYSSEKETYLFDLRQGLPDSIVTCSGVVRPDIGTVIFPAIAYTYYDDLAEINFQKNSLFDTLYFGISHTVRKSGSEVFSIGDPSYPLNHGYSGTLKPGQSYGPINKQLGLYRMTGRYNSFVSNDWHDGKVSFSSSDFGDFTFLKDTTPPKIVPVFIDSLSSRFSISDDLSGIAGFEATLNGNWLLLNFDTKSGALSTVRKVDAPAMKGILVISVTDNAGNSKKFETTLK